MRARNERGSIMTQVLVTMVFMMVISVSIMRMRLQPAMNAARSVTRVRENLEASAALNILTEVWAQDPNGSCTTDKNAGVECSGGRKGECACKCNVKIAGTVGTVVVSVSPSPQGGDACALSIAPPTLKSP